MKDLAYLNAGAARQILNEGNNLSLTDSIEFNEQTRGSNNHISLDYNGEINAGSFFEIDSDLMNNLLSLNNNTSGDSEYRFDIWLNSGGSIRVERTYNNESIWRGGSDHVQNGVVPEFMSKGNEQFETLYKALDDWLYPPEVKEDSVARDVDADFSGKIDLADLAVLDADWGKTLHTGDETFQGSSTVSWDLLDSQGTTGDANWDNTAFKTQNEIEYELGNINQTLDAPGAVGVIGGDDANDSQTNDLLGTDFQDPLIG
tara:strand:- start:915 stop:1691 length:777 start_codon:yes stop_codon:yes gene_type:complete